MSAVLSVLRPAGPVKRCVLDRAEDRGILGGGGHGQVVAGVERRFVFGGAAPAECLLDAARVVPALDPPEDPELGLVAGPPDPPVDELDLDGAELAFGHRVVEGIPDAAQ